MRRFFIWSIVVVILAAVALWFYLNYIDTTSIKKILDNPRDFDGKLITISGIVTDRTSLMLIKYFTVKDKTDEIKVITKKPLPSLGSKVKVRGKVNANYSLGPIQIIVLIEE